MLLPSNVEAFLIHDNLLRSTGGNSSVVKQHDSGASFVILKFQLNPNGNHLVCNGC